jgi:hypothetical protein
MKQRASKLDEYAESLHQWFGAEKLTLAEVQKRLAEGHGVKVAISSLSEWWSREMDREREAELFARIATGSRVAGEVADLAKDAAPDQRALMALVQSLVVQLSLHGELPQQVKMIAPLIQRIQEGQRLELADRAVRVNEGKLEILRRKAEQLDQAKGVAQNTSMTEEEKQARINQILGLS